MPAPIYNQRTKFQRSTLNDKFLYYKLQVPQISQRDRAVG